MSKKMTRYPTDRKVYVGDLGNNARKNDLEYAFGAYGTLRSVWIARNPPGFAFVEFEDARDAADAVRGLDGRTVCGRRARVELSTGKFVGGSSRRGDGDRFHGGGGDRGGGGGDRGGRNNYLSKGAKCYECGGRGHYARECRRQKRNRRRSNSRSRSRSVSHGRNRSRSASRSNSRSRSVSAVKETSSRSNKTRDSYTTSKSKENGRSAGGRDGGAGGENGVSSRYSDDDRNGGGADSPPVPKRRYNDSPAPSPKRSRSAHSKQDRSISRRRGGSTVSRSRSSSRRD